MRVVLDVAMHQNTTMRRRTVKAVTVLMATALAVGLVEFLSRLAIEPSAVSSGRLMSVELPPTRILRRARPPDLLSASSLFPGAVFDGVPMTRGDLVGLFRLDADIGYAPVENAASQNRWWQSNNLGARSRHETAWSVRADQRRLLVFGESFAQGSRLPQEEAWPTMLQGLDDRVEVVNFAVDGYSMAQALLRYRQVREKLHYDMVVLMFVPEADLMRDINTMRQLIDPAWDAPLAPRFRLERDALTVVPPIYRDPLELHRRNRERLTDELRHHLRAHDRLYFRARYEAVPVIGQSVWARLTARALWRHQERQLHNQLMNPDGEAVQVSRAIFQTMQREAHADGATFALVLLPIEHQWWDGTASDRDRLRWAQMVDAVCGDRMVCVDLLPTLGRVPPQDVDRAFDYWHFGPKMNRRIAVSVQREVLDTRN